MYYIILKKNDMTKIKKFDFKFSNKKKTSHALSDHECFQRYEVKNVKRGAFILTLFPGHGKHDSITVLLTDMGQIILSNNIQRVISGWALPFQHF